MLKDQILSHSIFTTDREEPWKKQTNKSHVNINILAIKPILKKVLRRPQTLYHWHSSKQFRKTHWACKMACMVLGVVACYMVLHGAMWCCKLHVMCPYMFLCVACCVFLCVVWCCVFLLCVACWCAFLCGFACYVSLHVVACCVVLHVVVCCCMLLRVSACCTSAETSQKLVLIKWELKNQKRTPTWAAINCFSPSTVMPLLRTPRTVGNLGSSLLGKDVTSVSHVRFYLLDWSKISLILPHRKDSPLLVGIKS